MSDRYLFRAKWVDGGAWVYGLPHEGEKNLIVSTGYIDFDCEFYAPEYWWVVDPTTIGQCTGLKDMNGKLIFEGDILASDKLEKFRQCPDDLPYAVVEWSKAKACWRGDVVTACYEMQASSFGDCEIIDNVHDNPELGSPPRVRGT